jgi:hypothetical protein
MEGGTARGGGSSTAVGWPAVTQERRSWEGGGASVPHGHVPTDKEGGRLPVGALTQ